MAQNQYITKQQLEWVFSDLNFDTCSEDKKQEMLDRATGDLEADLSKKFVVPLVAKANGPYLTAPQFARNKILNAMKAKVREIIGYQLNKTLVGTVDSSEHFINVHGLEYKAQMKGVLDPLIDYGFLLLDQAQEAQTPVQHIGLSRANNNVDPFDYYPLNGGRVF